jgi:hypothetical protein
MGDVTPEQLSESYKGFFALYISPLLEKYDIKLDDITHLFQVALQPLDYTKEAVERSVSEAHNAVAAFLWKVKDLSDVRISDVVRVQKEMLASKVVPETAPVKAEAEPVVDNSVTPEENKA